ncbi:MAG: polymer-forming cytoskeletal protein [Patescibacteria group bacterium]|jgi:hypothetical protein
MFKRIFYSALVVILIMSISAPVMAAPTFLIADENGIVSLSKPVNDDAYIAGGNVTIDQDIWGDLFVAGGTIDINTDIAGDLFISGGNISIRGSVGDDVHIGGGNISIYGEIKDDLMIGGGTVLIADTATVRGDLLVGTGNFDLYGTVLGNVKAGFGNAKIAGVINGNADLRYGDGKLIFADGAKIRGQLDYWAKSENNSFDKIAGTITYHKMTSSRSSLPIFATIFVPTVILMGMFWPFISILLLGGLLILLLPKYLPRMVETTKKDYWTALWQGLLFIIVAPVLALLIAFTGVGIPISVIMMLSFVILAILASVPVSMAIGSYLLKYKEGDKAKQFGALAIGALVYVIVGSFPLIGWLVKLILFVIGIGAIWVDSRSMIKKGIY